MSTDVELRSEHESDAPHMPVLPMTVVLTLVAVLFVIILVGQITR